MRKYKQVKRKEIVFATNEWEIIEKRAAKLNINTTEYIREAALAFNLRVVSRSFLLSEFIVSRCPVHVNGFFLKPFHKLLRCRRDLRISVRRSGSDSLPGDDEGTAAGHKCHCKIR